MPATFTPIDATALRSFLTSLRFSPEPIPHTRETAYVRRSKTDPGVGIVVYTSQDGTTTRGRGEDAVRVCLVDLAKGRGLKTSKRVHRTGGQAAIQARIKERVAELAEWFGGNIGPRASDGRLTWRDSGRPLDYRSLTA